MDGIERIVSIFHNSIVWPLFSPVQPYGEQSKKSETLLGEQPFPAKQVKGIDPTAHHLKVDNPKTDQLSGGAPPTAASEQIEYQHGQYTEMHIVGHADQSDGASQQQTQSGEQPSSDFSWVVSGLFDQVDQAEANQEGPEDILMPRVEYGAASHQIKGNFRKDGKSQKPMHVQFQIPGAEVSLHGHECEDGKGDATNAGQPLIAGHDSGPEMVTQHKDHSQNMKAERREFKPVFLFHCGTHFGMFSSSYNTLHLGARGGIERDENLTILVIYGTLARSISYCT